MKKDGRRYGPGELILLTDGEATAVGDAVGPKVMEDDVEPASSRRGGSSSRQDAGSTRGK
jgi:hypothetical protein